VYFYSQQRHHWKHITLTVLSLNTQCTLPVSCLKSCFGCGLTPRFELHWLVICWLHVRSIQCTVQFVVSNHVYVSALDATQIIIVYKQWSFWLNLSPTLLFLSCVVVVSEAVQCHMWSVCFTAQLPVVTSQLCEFWCWVEWLWCHVFPVLVGDSSQWIYWTTNTHIVHACHQLIIPVNTVLDSFPFQLRHISFRQLHFLLDTLVHLQLWFSWTAHTSPGMLQQISCPEVFPSSVFVLVNFAALTAHTKIFHFLILSVTYFIN